MKIKNFMWMATSCLVALTACNKDDVVDGPTPEGGEEATIQLVITNPTATTYAADDDNARDNELIFNTVDVFIYDDQGLLDKHYQLDGTTDFNPSSTIENAYVAEKTLVTTEGQKEIYVGVNLPSNIRQAIAGRSNKIGLSEAVNVTVDQLAPATAGFAMLNSEVVTQNLVPITAANPVNAVTVAVSRMVAKVTVEKALQGDPYVLDGGSIPQNTLKWTIKQVNTQMFPMQQKQGNAVIDPNYEPNISYPGSIFVDHSSPYINIPDYLTSTAGKDLTPLYTTENTQRQTFANQMTYLSVQAVFVPEKFVDQNGAEKPDVAVAGQDFWVVALNNGYMYFFNVQTEAEAFRANNAANVLYLEKYTNGLCYYDMYLNVMNANNPYGVLRNDFYRTKITRINGIGNPGPDPGEISKTAVIDLTVDIEPWNAISDDYQLRRR